MSLGTVYGPSTQEAKAGSSQRAPGQSALYKKFQSNQG